MPAQEMRAVLVRLTPIEHALLQTILREEAFTMQAFFRQAAKRKIQQRAHAFAAMEGDDRENA
jgi:DNA-binding MarR family transcriptional regulator